MDGHVSSEKRFLQLGSTKMIGVILLSLIGGCMLLGTKNPKLDCFILYYFIRTNQMCTCYDLGKTVLVLSGANLVKFV